MITADQILAHMIGDYILQSHWMATEKTKQSVAALVHVLTYMLPFMFLRPSLPALAVIVLTHFVIDRWRLARYLVWAKNWIGPFWHGRAQKQWYDTSFGERYINVTLPPINLPWEECKATGYQPDTPPWLAVWLMIICDNLCHILINGLALKYL